MISIHAWIRLHFWKIVPAESSIQRIFTIYMFNTSNLAYNVSKKKEFLIRCSLALHIRIEYNVSYTLFKLIHTIKWWKGSSTLNFICPANFIAMIMTNYFHGAYIKPIIFYASSLFLKLLHSTTKLNCKEKEKKNWNKFFMYGYVMISKSTKKKKN